MKKQTILTTMILALFSASAFADYVIKVDLAAASPDFKQYYDNIGANPDDESVLTKDINCTIRQVDFDAFDAKLLKVSDEETTTCVVDFAVPKATFDLECNAGATSLNDALWNVMRSKGVNGVSSIGYFGECTK